MSIHFEHEYPNFAYEAWGYTFHCLLRVRVFPNGDLAMFVSDAHKAADENYPKGGRVTQNIELIFESAVRMLLRESRIPGKRAPWFGSARKAIDAVAARTRLVQCSSSELDGPVFAVVQVFGGLSWSYIAQEEIVALDGVDAAFIDLEPRLNAGAPLPASSNELRLSVDGQSVDGLFSALQGMKRMLPQARSLGINIGISEPMRTALLLRHGDRAADLLRNCPVR